MKENEKSFNTVKKADERRMALYEEVRSSFYPNSPLTYSIGRELLIAPFDDEIFDLVIMSNMSEIHKVSQNEDIYKEIYRIVKDGGILVLEDERDESHDESALASMRRGYLSFIDAGFRVHHDLDAQYGDVTKQSLQKAHTRRSFNGRGVDFLEFLNDGLYKRRPYFHVLRVLTK